MAAFGTKYVAQLWPVFTQYEATEAVTYRHVGEPVVDMSTGLTTTPIAEEAVAMVFASYAGEDIDGEKFISGDEMGLCPKTLLATPPNSRDRMLREAKEWDIVIISESGNGALWKFQVRRASGASG